MKALVLCDLIADISLRLPGFPVNAKDIQRLSYMDLGPGGACNAAIMAARFGLHVGALGEVGSDTFGEIVRTGLQREGVDLSQLVVSEDGRTPVAGVLVDPAGEPAYLGYRGDLKVRSWPDQWNVPISEAAALYADGWAEMAETPSLILRGFEQAQANNVPVFFDPGPGNPDVDANWVPHAVSLATVLLVNKEEGQRLSGQIEDAAVLDALLGLGPAWVVLKCGAEGLVVANRSQRAEVPGFAVEVRDTTGAGDSVSGAIMYGVLAGMAAQDLAVLCNATGAAKVQKLGTGHNLPTMAEIAVVLSANGYDPAALLPAASNG